MAFLRHILFVIIWACTLGRHHFWLLPNLTEDVGFLDSFWPIYQYEYKGPAPAEPPDVDSKSTNDEAANKESRKMSSEQGDNGDNNGNGFELVDHPNKEKQS